jgi:ribonuclease VapC
VIAVDTSALVAIVFGEHDAERHLSALRGEATSLSTVSLVEATMVVEARQGADAGRDLLLLVEGAIDEVVPVDEHHAAAAAMAWRRFGRGRHPAGLNFGDCFSYALARTAGIPLLFKGEDFTQTDIESAL